LYRNIILETQKKTAFGFSARAQWLIQKTKSKKDQRAKGSKEQKGSKLFCSLIRLPAAFFIYPQRYQTSSAPLLTLFQ